MKFFVVFGSLALFASLFSWGVDARRTSNRPESGDYYHSTVFDLGFLQMEDDQLGT